MKISAPTPEPRTFTPPAAPNAASNHLSSHWDSCSEPPPSPPIWLRLRCPPNSKEQPQRGTLRRTSLPHGGLRDRKHRGHTEARSSIKQVALKPSRCMCFLPRPKDSSLANQCPGGENIFMLNITQSSFVGGAAEVEMWKSPFEEFYSERTSRS